MGPGGGPLREQDARGETLGFLVGPAYSHNSYGVSGNTVYLGRQDNLLWIANANTGRVAAGAGYFIYESTDCSGKPHLYMGDSPDKHPQMLYTYLGCEQQDQTTQLYRMVGETHSLAARSFRGGDASCSGLHGTYAVRDLEADSHKIPGPYKAPITIQP